MISVEQEIGRAVHAGPIKRFLKALNPDTPKPAPSGTCDTVILTRIAPQNTGYRGEHGMTITTGP